MNASAASPVVRGLSRPRGRSRSGRVPNFSQASAPRRKMEAIRGWAKRPREAFGASRTVCRVDVHFDRGSRARLGLRPNASSGASAHRNLPIGASRFPHRGGPRVLASHSALAEPKAEWTSISIAAARARLGLRPNASSGASAHRFFHPSVPFRIAVGRESSRGIRRQPNRMQVDIHFDRDSRARLGLRPNASSGASAHRNLHPSVPFRIAVGRESSRGIRRQPNRRQVDIHFDRDSRARLGLRPNASSGASAHRFSKPRARFPRLGGARVPASHSASAEPNERGCRFRSRCPRSVGPAAQCLVRSPPIFPSRAPVSLASVGRASARAIRRQPNRMREDVGFDRDARARLGLRPNASSGASAHRFSQAARPFLSPRWGERPREPFGASRTE